MKGIDYMQKLFGMSEVKHEEQLKAFLKKNSVHNDIFINPNGSDKDGLPWCAAIMNACERAAYGLQAGTGKLNARSFLSYGTKVSLNDAKVGDILIFTRGDSSWQGHVTYLKAVKVNGFICLGGNQSDSVNEAFYSTAHLLGIRRSPFEK